MTKLIITGSCKEIYKGGILQERTICSLKERKGVAYSLSTSFSSGVKQRWMLWQYLCDQDEIMEKMPAAKEIKSIGKKNTSSRCGGEKKPIKN